MPFIRHARDKRGYETTFVMHAYWTSQGPQQTRVLYLFRSPSHIKLGRQPLDEEAREALEHTHPDLSFDWSVIGREAVRVDEREAWRGRRGGGQEQPKPAPPAPVTTDDQSLLGRTLGAATASRFRARHADLLQRIARRSRTREERDRLTERAQRLNPDDWPDAEAIRVHARTVEADWDALAAELPSRRRGRRGGRRREESSSDEGPVPDSFEPVGDPSDPSDTAVSAIMAPEGNEDAGEISSVDTAQPVDPGDGRRADADSGGAGADGGTAGHGLPGRDQLRQD